MPEAARSGPARALAKLGLLRDIDLALHLPLRYEDETRLTPLSAARDGETVQVQGVVRDNRIETRPRRQLVLRLQDGNDELVLRFLHFYPAQQRNWAPGRLLRVRGELRDGFFGREMVHPTVRLVEEDTPLPQALTPVYPTSAQLPQAYLRKAVASALARAPLDELWPAALWPRARACRHCASRAAAAPAAGRHAAGGAGGPQQPGLAAAEVRRTAGPAAVAADGARRARGAARTGAGPGARRPARAAAAPRCPGP